LNSPEPNQSHCQTIRHLLPSSAAAADSQKKLLPPCKMSPNGRSKHTLPLHCNRCNTNGSEEDLRLLIPQLASLNLTISCLGTMYRAYGNNDRPIMAFVIFVYFAYFWSGHCHTKLNKLPPSDNSFKKKFLQFNIWFFASAILFGFACEFGTFLGWAATLFLFGVAIAGSSLLFYVYFICDDKTSPQLSRPGKKVSDDGNKDMPPI
ncbi:hypothetical protein F2P56_000058, partial [Juglans regia]